MSLDDEFQKSVTIGGSVVILSGYRSFDGWKASLRFGGPSRKNLGGIAKGRPTRDEAIEAAIASVRADYLRRKQEAETVLGALLEMEGWQGK